MTRDRRPPRGEDRLASRRGHPCQERGQGQEEGTAPDRIAVDVLGAADAERLGASAVLKVERADGGGRSAPVRLSVDYSSFAEGYGGSYGSRLRLVELPPCAAVAAPGSKACPERPKVLPTTNNPQSQTLSADVTAAPEAAGTSAAKAVAPSLFAVAAGPSSAQGTYKATALAPASSWNVAASSGGFSWNYPLKAVSTPGGLVPTVGLGYPRSPPTAAPRPRTTRDPGPETVSPTIPVTSNAATSPARTTGMPGRASSAGRLKTPPSC